MSTAFSLRRLLRKILLAKRRATASYISPLSVDLTKAKLKDPRPFVSIHVALYNEKKVVERLIKACTAQDWFFELKTGNLKQETKSKEANYEFILADDSTDETTQIAKQVLIDGGWTLVSTSGKSPIEPIGADLTDSAKSALNQRESAENQVELFTFTKADGPVVKLIHRGNRSGFKGGALQRALEESNPKAEYIVVLDADFVPYPDTIEQFVKTFQVLAPIKPIDADLTDSAKSAQNQSNQRDAIAAVQGYQWHVLNKSQNWVTRGVRTEYAGNYVIERSTEELYGGLKQIAGSVYMIRADILRKFGWGTSITEDFELTLRLYEAGYKVVFTPYIQVPAEAVSTIKRLIRQRMRWAEGSSFNVKVMLPRLLSSPNLSLAEKLEVVYFSFYYLQAAFFVVGTFGWFISETIFNATLPFWTAALGWSLVFTNLLALPLMNIVGMFLEESEERDYLGILSFIALSYIVVPFQAYAAVKGFLEKEEGPWFRTPKTGLVTDVIGRSSFGKFFGGLLRKPALIGPIKTDFADVANSAQSVRISANRRMRFGGSLALLSVSNPFKPSLRVRFVSKGVIAVILVFSMIVNYLAFVGDVLNQPEQNQLEAEQTSPTKLGESNLAAVRPQEFVAKIERIEVDESTKIASDIDFLYRSYLDDDNLAMFGRRYANQDANVDCANVCESIGVVRIVYAQGKYIEYDLPEIIGGPTASSAAVSYEFAQGLIDFKVQASRLAWDYTYFEQPATNHIKFDLSMSETFSPRRQDVKGWQVVDDVAKSTVFFLKNPEAKDTVGAKAGAAFEITPASGQYQMDMGVDENLLAFGSYPVVVSGEIETNPPYPVFDIADARENNASDYNWVVTVPGNGNKVGFNKKGANTVGYRIDTGDELYNMEMFLRERSAAPASVEGGKITYDLGTMDVVFEVWTDRVKADYILKEKPSKNTIDFTFFNYSQIPTYNVFCPDNPEGLPVEDLPEGGVRCVKQGETGSISFWGDDGYGNINNSEIFRLDIPEIRDGNGNQIPKEKVKLSFSKDLVPDKLVPKYCMVEDLSCKNPAGYYDRSGVITLTIDQNFLDSAVYPVTIDPTSVYGSADSGGTYSGSQRKLLITSDNDLVVFFRDSSNDIFASYSNNNGISWTSFGTVYTGLIITVAAAIDSSNNVHLSFDESGAKYIQVSNMITANDIDGTWTISSPVTLHSGSTGKDATMVVDVNGFPAVSWAYQTTGSTKDSAVRFSRAVADPTTTTNWECATASSCAYVKTTNCSTDVCGDHLQPTTGVNSNSHSTIVKAPSTATNADELMIVTYWADDGDLDAYAATVNGANYNTWSRLCTTDCETTSAVASGSLSALAVDDGTNQRIWVAWDDNGSDPAIRLSYFNADSNAWTSDADTGAGEASLSGDMPSLAYDSQEEDIYVWFQDLTAEMQIHFRKFDINNIAWDSSDQVFDLTSVVGDDIRNVNLKEYNTPTSDPGPKLDLVYIDDSTANSVFYSTWHTKETRHRDAISTLPTTEALTITNGSDDASAFFDENEYDDTSSDNAVYVSSRGTGSALYHIHTFKKTNTNSTDEIQISWNVDIDSDGPCTSGNPCVLQIYQWGNSGCTVGWETLQSDTTTASGEITLSGTKNTSLSCYYSGTDADDHLGSNTVAARFYHPLTSTVALFKTDVVTFAFVPEKVLWLLPLALFLPRIMRKFGWQWRRKAYIPISADYN